MMFDFASVLNLPWIWAGIIATAVLLYVLLDGFVLGVGIILPFTPSDRCRDGLLNSVAPFWDANQTWLVLGGGGMLAAFPLAYSTLFAAFYIPIIAMLLGLIFRGAAFEFRYKETCPKRRLVWTSFFHFGSLAAAFFQGTILGGFVQGITVTGRSFSGGPLDWATAFSLLVGVALVFWYALLGATWTVLKTTDILQKWARNVALYCSIFVTMFLGFIGIFMPLVQSRIWERWFSPMGMGFFGLLSTALGLCLLGLWRSLSRDCDKTPFVYTVGIFLIAYAEFLASMAPWIVPFHFTIEQACAATTSLSLMLVGVALVLPCILGYTAYTYYIFWGKTHYDQPHA